MATNGNPWALGSDTHNARVLRNLAGAMFGLPLASHANAIAPTTRGGAYGVVGDTDLAVTLTGGLGYSVAVGGVVNTGTFALGQGVYVGYNDAAVAASVAAHSAFIRHDLVCYRVRDTDEDATGSEDDGIIVVQGISGSTDPAIPSSLGSLVVLARIVLPATSGALTVTDLRQWATALGGRHRCRSSQRPTGNSLNVIRHIRETDTGALLFWNGSAWVYEYKPRADYTPTAPNWTLGNAVVDTDYHIVGGRCFYQGVITLGTTSAFPGTFIPQLTLPVNADVSVAYRMGTAWMLQGDAVQAHDARSVINASIGAGLMQIQNVQGATNTTSITGAIPFTWESSGEDQFGWDINYPVA